MKILLLNIAFCGCVLFNIQAQDIQSFNTYDFVAGEKIIFEDNLSESIDGKRPTQWNLEGGNASIESKDKEKYISISEYYTKLSPKLVSQKSLPTVFTIEYDAWLDAGYDGNPGVEIHLVKGDQEIIITPNKHNTVVSYPNDGKAMAKNPDEYFGENMFYDRWVHFSIAYINKRLIVYLDQYKLLDVANCELMPDKIGVTGNTSQGMKMLFKNFKLATSIPQNAFELVNGKFITHSIKFDVNESIVKPESMSVVNEIVKYLKSNPGMKFEIGGHTDSDGNDDGNLKLSEERAAAVRQLLILLEVKESQLSSKGYGETSPIDTNTTLEGKANNRRVEFVKI